MGIEDNGFAVAIGNTEVDQRGQAELIKQQARAIERLCGALDESPSTVFPQCPPTKQDESCAHEGDGPVDCAPCWKAWAMEDRDDG